MALKFAQLEEIEPAQRKRSTMSLHRGDFRLHMTPARKTLLKRLIEGELLQVGFTERTGSWFARIELLPFSRCERRGVTRPVGEDVLLAMRWSSLRRPLRAVSDDQNVSPGPRLWALWQHPSPHWMPYRSDAVIVGLTQAGRERAQRLLDDKFVDFYAGDRNPEPLRV
jgi:hypothetical protein